MRRAMQKNSSGDEFGAVLEIIKVHRANALVSVNVEHLLTNWEIGGYLSAKIKHDGWGKSTIDSLVEYIHTHAPNERGYGRSSLYSMVAVYEKFTSPEFSALIAKYGKRIERTPSPQMADCGIVQLATGQLTDAGIVQMPSGQMAIPQVLLLTTFSVVEYALSRSMSPAMVAEYKRLMIPKDVLQETYDRYIGMGEEKGGGK